MFDPICPVVSFRYHGSVRVSLIRFMEAALLLASGLLHSLDPPSRLSSHLEQPSAERSVPLKSKGLLPALPCGTVSLCSGTRFSLLLLVLRRTSFLFVPSTPFSWSKMNQSHICFLCFIGLCCGKYTRKSAANHRPFSLSNFAFLKLKTGWPVWLSRVDLFMSSTTFWCINRRLGR